MDGTGIINYQGSKANLLNFINEGLRNYIKEGDCILDIFSGSGAVSNALKAKYKVYSNDSELYASIIADGVLNSVHLPDQIINELSDLYNNNYKKLYKYQKEYFIQEGRYIENSDTESLIKLYKDYPTVWKIENNVSPEILREKNDYNLFSFYYATTYFGIIQSAEIDSLIYAIKMLPEIYNSTLYCFLFYAIKETVFSKDGHMAQPLDPCKYPDKLLLKRQKKVKSYFLKKMKENNLNNDYFFSKENKSFNKEFTEIFKEKNIIKNINMIYADPPYTDMQYSRYYHLLNVACKYDYPDLTVTKNGFTKGLYTEGRYQSKLSQKSNAKEQIRFLIEECKKNDIKLAMSYAYPQNTKEQAVDRYTVSIEELISMSQYIFGNDYVQIKQILYSHSNNRNSAAKKVIEYLIICGKPLVEEKKYNIQQVKSIINNTKPIKNNPIYNSHLYWSQKSFNICDILIRNLSQEGDVVFDPFMGSGVTVLQAISSEVNRIGIGCDVNEMPVFIVKTLLNETFNTNNIKNVLNDFIEKVCKLEVLYNTKCPVCNGNAIINNCVFDKPERTQNNIKIKSVNYKCDHCGNKGNKEPSEEDYSNMINEYNCVNIENIDLIRNSKIAVGDNDKIKDIFTNRNFYILDQIVVIINSYNEHERQILRYILMSILHLCKITDKHSNSQWPLWIPKIDCVEKNIISILVKKCKQFTITTQYVQDKYYKESIVNTYDELKPNKCMLLLKGSQYITEEELPNHSVSLIITDPPYLEQVMYSEYMQLYKPFVGLEYNLNDEIIVSSAPSRKKDKNNYFNLLQNVFEMCATKLQINGYMCLYFHDSNLSVWWQLVSILNQCGFKYVSQIHIKKTVTLKNIISPKKSLNGDSILFFINTGNSIELKSGKETVEEIELNIIKQAKFLIKQETSMSTPELYDNGLMEILIQNGWLKKISEKYSSLVEIFEKHLFWDKSISKWRVCE